MYQQNTNLHQRDTNLHSGRYDSEFYKHKNVSKRCNFVSPASCFIINYIKFVSPGHNFVSPWSQICDYPVLNLYLAEANLLPDGLKFVSI